MLSAMNSTPRSPLQHFDIAFWNCPLCVLSSEEQALEFEDALVCVEQAQLLAPAVQVALPVSVLQVKFAESGCSTELVADEFRRGHGLGVAVDGSVGAPGVEIESYRATFLFRDPWV